MLLPQEIRNHTFGRAIRGYTPAEVDEFINFLADTVDSLNRENAELEQKLRKSLFTLDDYLDQLGQIKNMGGVEQLMGMIPGMKPSALKDAKIDENALAHTEAIIQSMTKKEREHPEIIQASRKIRIAKGSGTSVEEVNKLLKQFDQMRKMIKQFSSGGMKRSPFGKMKIPFG